MTDREAIENLRRFNNGESLNFLPSAIDQVLRLAESKIEEPPPGSVEVRIDVAVSNAASDVYACHYRGESNAGEWWGQPATHAAIVRAWILPVATPEVMGSTE